MGFMDFGVIPIEGRKRLEIISVAFYEIPSRATHLYLRNGHISFGFSPSFKFKEREKSRRGRFLKIPAGARTVCFPEYSFKSEGHHYGQPQWL